MGNTEQRKIKSFFPSTQNLDNPSTKSQENHQHSSQSFATSYDPKKQSLLQLTLTDNVEIELISQNIQLYTQPSRSALHQGYYSTISSLRQFYKVKKDGYCTKQYMFYLIFQGCSCCSLSDEFGLRQMMNKRFTDQQILSILKTYLAGIFIYIKKFKRHIEKIDLDDIGFEVLNLTNHSEHFLKRRIRIFFTEPWLKQKRQQQILTVNEVNILLQNPSPERLRLNNSKIVQQFDQFEEKTVNSYGNDPQKSLLSLLFSVGVIGLKLLEMGFVDDIYMRAPSKRVSFERVKEYIEKHQTVNQHYSPNRNFGNNITYDSSASRKKLLSGLRILLLSNSPEERERIYEFWSVKLDGTNYLDEINLEYSGHFQGGREESQSLQDHNQIVPMVETSNFPVRNRGRSKTSSVFGKLYDIENGSLSLDQAQTTHQQTSIVVQKDPFPNRNYVYKQDQMKLSKIQNGQIHFGNPNFIQNPQQIYPPNYQNQQLPFQNALLQNRIPQRRATTIVRNSDGVFNQQQQRIPNYQPFPNGGQNKVITQELSLKSTHQRAFLYTGV